LTFPAFRPRTQRTPRSRYSATGQLADGGIQAQTRHAIERIDRCLAAAGTSLDKVAKVNFISRISE
jgi:enamine deaminase RidA (YjgF/YER057c/UK114 family)